MKGRKAPRKGRFLLRPVVLTQAWLAPEGSARLNRRRGRLAQLVRASRLHREGREFESLTAYHASDHAFFFLPSSGIFTSAERSREKPCGNGSGCVRIGLHRTRRRDHENYDRCCIDSYAGSFQRVSASCHGRAAPDWSFGIKLVPPKHDRARFRHRADRSGW